MAKPHGFSVRIFIPSGDLEGLRTVEKSNWTGQGLVFPRSLFPEVRKLPELARTGVYVLWDPSESGQLPLAYIGEGDVLLPRLDSHAKTKDFWTQAVVFTSKDQNLNKAHVQYLEARLVELAGEAKRCKLDNDNAPKAPSLSEADAADSEAFLADLLLCLPIVGVSFFDKPRAPAGKRTLILQVKGAKARGYEGVDGFVVRKGAPAVKSQAPSIQMYLAELRHTLQAKGVLVDAGETLKLTQDYTFSSPSMAAGVLLGRSSNGRMEWKDAEGRSLKEIQEAVGLVEEIKG